MNDTNSQAVSVNQSEASMSANRANSPVLTDSETRATLSIDAVQASATEAPLAEGARNTGSRRAKRRRGWKAGGKETSSATGGATDAMEGASNNGERPRSAPTDDASSGHDASASAANGQAAPKRKRHRRQKRRKWKPYYKMSTEEKRQQEEREAARAVKMRAERMAQGQPMAPYNTTQFLLEDRVAQYQQGPDVDALLETLERERCHSSNVAAGGGGGMRADHRRGTTTSGTSASNDSCSRDGGGAGDTDSEMEREFEAEYDRATAERLESMTKSELIRDYLALEHELERTGEELERYRRANADLVRLRHERQEVVQPPTQEQAADSTGVERSATDDNV